MVNRQQDTRSGRTPVENSRDGNEEASSLTSNGDSILLRNSDHSGMTLISMPLTRENYIPWSRSVKIALGVDMKIGFIDGTCVKHLLLKHRNIHCGKGSIIWCYHGF